MKMNKYLCNIFGRKIALPAFSIIETIISTIIITIIITTTTVILSNSFNIGKDMLKLNKMIEINNQRASFYKNNTNLVNYELSENLYNYQKKPINEAINEITINTDYKQLTKVFLIKTIVINEN